ncbi:hypothetical protein SRABI128_05495 [Microbacterium sp. Bi128]|nr:hypothetical protein SRABI128_05495 [Microbacterium sp. Bi128]
MRRDRTVVDDPSALGRLGLHGPDGGTGAKEGPREVHGDGRVPVLHGDLVHRGGGAEHAGVVEEHVHALPLPQRGGEKPFDVGGDGDIARDRERLAVAGRGLSERFFPPPRQDHPVALGQHEPGHCAADAGTGSGDNGDPSGGVVLAHEVLLDG